MNNATNAFKQIFSGQALFSDFNISVKECIEAAKELRIREFDAKLLNAEFRELVLNELCK